MDISSINAVAVLSFYSFTFTFAAALCYVLVFFTNSPLKKENKLSLENFILLK